MNLWIIFLTGLTTGGLSCLAMQGGLLAGVVANQKREELTDGQQSRQAARKHRFMQLDAMDWMPVGMFLIMKLIVHTAFGFLLGALGSVITLSIEVRLFFQAFTALFMFATAMNLLNVHPIFRYVAFQPPRFIRKWIRHTSQSQALFAPAILGAMTIFIPCGVTQAMEVNAINSGSPVTGALIMFSFVLGTMPLFSAIGVMAAKLAEVWQARLMKVAAITLVLLAVSGLNGVLVVLDAPITVQKVVSPIAYFFSPDRFGGSAETTPVANGLQSVTIQANDDGYSPRYFKVKQGTPVALTVTSNGTYSCAVAFTFKEFGLSAFLQPTDSKTFTFTPEKKGKFTYACSMGMYTGTMEVI